MSLISALKSTLPTASVITDRAIMESYQRDQSTLSPFGLPQAVVLTRSVEDVQVAVQAAASEGVPIVPRGAGSGLSGGANAIDGCVVVVTAPMNRIIDLSTSELAVRVEPGVLTTDVKKAASRVHLYYPPDPASADFSSIGGNIATNAGGLCCIKYGVTRDYVMALDVVLSDGSLLQTGGLTRKSVAGFDITGLLVGSEGALGIIVGASLRLVPSPEHTSTVVAGFGSTEGVGRLPGLIARAGVTPSMLEVMDRATLDAVEGRFSMGIGPNLEAMVIVQTDGPNHEEEAAVIADLADQLDAAETYHASDPAEAAMLLQARKLAFPALETLPGVALLDDVGVPLGRIGEMIDKIAGIGRSNRLRIATFGHLGDGNLHPTILFDPNDPEEKRRARDGFDSIIRGGACPRWHSQRGAWCGQP